MTNSFVSNESSTKERIMDEFWQLYKNGGIHNTSVTKICNLLNINRSTFYFYFCDIYEVLDTIEEKIISPLQFKSVILNNLILSNDKPQYIDNILDFFDENIKYLYILLGENGDPKFRIKLLKKLSPAINQELNFPKSQKKRLEYILEYQNSAVLSIIMKWYYSNKELSKKELVELIIDITTNGVKKELNKYIDYKP